MIALHLFVEFQEYVEDAVIYFVPSFTVAEKRALLSLHLDFVVRKNIFVIMVIINVGGGGGDGRLFDYLPYRI